MRVISGNLKGRKLKAPKGYKTRPTSDRVKEAIFNTIAPELINCQNFLDLFAGSGAIGIEALSRGIEKCVFVENSSNALKTLKENLKICDPKTIQVIFKDAFLVVDKFEPESFDIVFMDPPYGEIDIDLFLKKVEKIIANNGLLIVETEKNSSLPNELGTLINIKTSLYGDTKVTYFRRRIK